MARKRALRRSKGRLIFGVILLLAAIFVVGLGLNSHNIPTYRVEDFAAEDYPTDVYYQVDHAQVGERIINTSDADTSGTSFKYCTITFQDANGETCMALVRFYYTDLFFDQAAEFLDGKLDGTISDDETLEVSLYGYLQPTESGISPYYEAYAETVPSEVHVLDAQFDYRSETQETVKDTGMLSLSYGMAALCAVIGIAMIADYVLYNRKHKNDQVDTIDAERILEMKNSDRFR
jgi:hypothetical protein